MSRDSILEIQHKREQSHDSGTYQDWTVEETFPLSPGQGKNGDFVTVVAVDEKPFVTVLSVDCSPADSEEVLVYRLPGERLGFGLKFDGGVKSAEKVKKLLIQSCADDSPASRTRASWGPLSPGDEILVIDSVPVSEMTRMDCVRALKESNVVIKLRVRKANGGLPKEEDKEAPPIPPRKFPRKKELAAVAAVEQPQQTVQEETKSSPPVLPRSRQIPQAETYTDLISQENLLPTESESDDTGSSISTVVSRISSAPTTCNSSFSDAKSINSVDFGSTSPVGKQSSFDLDKVLEPFLHLEREFSSAAIDENNIFHKLAEASNLLDKKEEDSSCGVPKPAPRQERRRPPPPPPPPRTDRQPAYLETRHLPRLIDFVPKDRTDVVVPSPLVPPIPAPINPPEEVVSKGDVQEETKEDPEGAVDMQKNIMDVPEHAQKQQSNSYLKEYIPPPTCSRLPPDGTEAPPQPSASMKSPTDSVKSLQQAPLSKELKQKCNIEPKKISIETSKYAWKKDEKSEKSVKDKIAMFSNVQNNTAQNQTFKFTRKLSSSKLTDPETSDGITSSCQNNEKHNQFSTKLPANKGALPYHSLLDVSTNFESNSDLKKNEKTQSTLDLTSNTLASKVPINKDFSTLPRKSSDIPKHLNDEKQSTTTGNVTLSRAYSFSGDPKLHNRSQSLIDVAAKNPLLGNKHSDDLRRSSLAALTEQRKKNFSKLRGLVIPEKVVEVPSLVVDDLPIIKSNDCLIASKLEEEKHLSKPEIDKPNTNKPPIEKPALIPSTLWKSENNYEIPKYSPAFKRKSLSLYGTSSSVSSVSSSLSSSREELRTCFYEPKSLTNTNVNISKSLANLSRNPFSAQTEPKSLESITSPSISDLSSEYTHESVSPNSNSCNDVLSQLKYNEGYGSDSQRSKSEEHGEAESDNDSAVSSSRSSISPPHSPVSGGKKSDSSTPPRNRFDLKLKRTLSSETTVSNSSNGSTLTSGSQASCSSSGSSSSNLENKRVLKAQSVEAINRKNVLSSARYSSGINTEIKTDLETEKPVTDLRNNLQNDNQMEKLNDSSQNGLVNIEKENNYLQFSTSSPVNSSKSLSSPGSPFDSFNSSLGNEVSKNQNLTNELIKGETSFNIDNFTYSSHKAIDKNLNEKINEFSDHPDGILPPRWQTTENNQTDFLTPSNKLPKIVQLETARSNEKQKEDLPSPKAINVNHIKKVFEKVDNSYLPNARFKISQTCVHPRVSSVDSTNSDDSCVPNPSHYGSASNLLREQQFGSITSLASSTSLISQQELSQLIEEANHTLEDEGNAHEVVVVILHRDIPGGSIGITLAGGADYEAKEITVHKVLIGSPAERDGRIQKGDRILSINGKSMKGLTHYESLAILKAPRPEVVLVVSRHKGDSPEEGATSKNTASARMNRYLDSKALNQTKGKDVKWGPPITLTLNKDGAGLGFSLEGGKDSPYGDMPLTIKKIFTGGCADKNGNIFAGDELLMVNNIDVSELSRIEAWSLMKRLPDGEVVLSIRHPFA